jgi:hypothetical protein
MAMLNYQRVHPFCDSPRISTMAIHWPQRWLLRSLVAWKNDETRHVVRAGASSEDLMMDMNGP